MTAVVLGAGGQVGSSLAAALPGSRAWGRAELDLAEPGAIAAADWSGVDLIVNAAAYTAVDRAETAAGRVAAWQVNATAVAALARVADRIGATLVHFSSEYVFDGTAAQPWREDDPVAPLSAYGASKAAGDLAAASAARHYVVRTTWVVGNGANFVATMLGLAGRGIAPTVVADQIGRPTFAADLAAGVVRLLAARPPHGTVHLTNGGEPASWAEVARATFAAAGHDPGAITETTTAEYFGPRPEAARRPLNSVLALEKAGALGIALPDWRESLAGYVQGRVDLPAG